jgi:hypothetical protein
MLLGPHKKAQFIQIKSILSGWKQIIFCEFDEDMTKEIIYHVLSLLRENGGYQAKAIVSDNAATNVFLWKELKTNSEDCFFTDPYSNERVYMFSDPPHVLKLERNNLLDGGFVDGKGNIFSIEPINNLINDMKDNPSFHLSRLHVEVKGFQRQKVSTAAELLSNKTVAALTKNYPSDPLAANTARFCKVSNDLFDVFDTSFKPNKNPLKAPFIGSDEQMATLDEASKFFSDIRKMTKTGKRKEALLPFQKGALMSIQSLIMLWGELKDKFGIKQMATNQLNNDALESAFSCLRDKGFDDCPGPLSLLHRTKLHLLCKNKMKIKRHTNVKDPEDETAEYPSNLVGNFLRNADKNQNVQQSSCRVDLLETEQNYLDEIVLETLEFEVEDCDDFQKQVGMQLSKKFKWILDENETLSTKYLTISAQLVIIFDQTHGNGFNSKRNVIQNLISRVHNYAAQTTIYQEIWDENFLSMFFRYRVYKQIKFLNAAIINNRKHSSKKLNSATTSKRPIDEDAGKPSNTQKKLRRNTGVKAYTK